jgi:hypothetical protein
MEEVPIVLITLVPIALGSWWGWRRGLTGVLRRAAAIVLASGAGTAAAILLFRACIFEPLGISTPLAGGLVVFAAAEILLYVLSRRRRRGEPTVRAPRFRAAGSLAGALGGTYLAAISWIGLSFFAPPGSPSTGDRDPAGPAEGDGDLISALLRTAHEGFVRHVPVVGPFSDEMAALGLICRASREEHLLLSQDLGWDGLAELPTLRAIVEDPRLMADVDLGGGGDLRALYRLQKDPRIIAFFLEPEVQEVARRFRPVDLARRIEDIRAKEASRAAASRDR